MHYVAQTLGRQHLNLVAPDIEMPAHFKVSGGREAHDKGAVGLILQHLAGVELKAASMGGRRRAEPPNDLAELFLILEHAEGAIGERLQVELGVAIKRLVRHVSVSNLLDNVKPDRPYRIVLLPRDEIAAQSSQKTIGCDASFTRSLLVARLIIDLENAAGFDRLGDGCGYLTLELVLVRLCALVAAPLSPY